MAFGFGFAVGDSDFVVAAASAALSALLQSLHAVLQVPVGQTGRHRLYSCVIAFFQGGEVARGGIDAVCRSATQADFQALAFVCLIAFLVVLAKQGFVFCAFWHER